MDEQVGFYFYEMHGLTLACDYIYQPPQPNPSDPARFSITRVKVMLPPPLEPIDLTEVLEEIGGRGRLEGLVWREFQKTV